MNFNSEHNSGLPTQDRLGNRNITFNSLFGMYQQFMGAGVSQNYAALYLLDWLIMKGCFQYVLEIGTCKGGLALYLANMASVTEQFVFNTIEIAPEAYTLNRKNGSCGHWLDKIQSISDYFKMYFGNYEDHFNTVQPNIDKYKSLIICDGGNKVKESDVFISKIKSGDAVLIHDYGTEVFERDITNLKKKYDISVDSFYPEFKTGFILIWKK